MIDCPYIVGQKVECYEPPRDTYTSHTRSDSWVIGNVYTIKKITKSGKNVDTFILWLEEKSCGIYHQFVRPYYELPDELFEM